MTLAVRKEAQCHMGWRYAHVRAPEVRLWEPVSWETEHSWSLSGWILIYSIKAEYEKGNHNRHQKRTVNSSLLSVLKGGLCNDKDAWAVISNVSVLPTDDGWSPLPHPLLTIPLIWTLSMQKVSEARKWNEYCQQSNELSLETFGCLDHCMHQAHD